ncbi:MAG: 30S ribosomal protein S2 [Nanoarchaeota archaeon]|nr:30S ribosomal protein S2 [Nanoarchaeota archaeon]
MAEQQEFLIPLDLYLKVGLHIGTKFRTKYMEPFIYRVRPDGLAVLNVQKIDRRIDIASKFLSQYKPEDILIVCRRENGWRAAKLFSKLTGIRVFIGRYPPGLLTNLALENFTETKIMLVTDPWPDKNAVNDAVRVGIPIIALCDTNNTANNVDLIVPCNNKGKKSLGLIFWIIAKEYLKLRGVIKKDEDLKVTVDDFTPD